MLNREAAHRMTDQYRRGANRLCGHFDIVDILVEGCAGEIALAAAVATQRQCKGRITTLGEEAEKILPNPCAAIRAVDEKHPRTTGVVIG